MPGESREDWPEEAGGNREPDAHREEPDPPDGPEDAAPRKGKAGRRKSRREQRPAKGELAYGETKGHGDRCKPGEPTRGKAGGRNARCEPGELATRSRRRDSRPCEILNDGGA
jgi:hypothetical protein